MILDENLRKIFMNAHSIAIVGAKDKMGSPVEHVGAYLLSKGYRVLPVHPVRQSAWGIPCYKSLLDLEEVPDIVCLFRASNACTEHAREILSATWQPKVFWMQSGIVSEEAGKLMMGAGVTVVEDMCMEVEHKRLIANK